MEQTRGRADAYLAAAGEAVALVALSRVAGEWSRSSALPGWTVGSLAAHLLGQVFSVTATLAHPTGDAEPVSLMAHYERVPWRGASLDEPANVGIRAGGDVDAAAGPAELLKRARAQLAELALVLPALTPDQVVHAPWTQWAVTLDDFLATRLLEIAVHTDDLAASVGVDTPVLPEDVRQVVRHLLVDLAAQRHGDTAVLRALARAERAPASIAAL